MSTDGYTGGRTGLALALAACLPLSALAADGPGADSRYTYLQGYYVTKQELETDVGQADGDGYGVDLSYRFHPGLYGFARGHRAELDEREFRDDIDSHAVGLGVRHAVLGHEGVLDLYAELAYAAYDLEERDSLGNEVELEGDGYGATVGLRWMATPVLELNPYAGYVDYGTLDGEFNDNTVEDASLDGVRYGVRGVLEFADSFAVTAGLERGNLDLSGPAASLDYEETQVRLGLRYYLGKLIGGMGDFGS